MLVGLAATLLNVVVATLIGGISGFLGGKLDLAVQRFVDAWMAFPGLLLLLTIMSIVGQGLFQLILVLGISGGIVGSRVVRGAVIGVKENDFFLAARAVGTPTSRILIRHVLPNIMAPIIIIFSINIGGVIIAEASLSFLGFGLPPDIPSWGSMLSGEGRKYMEQAPWLALWPGLCLTIVVYALNMFGDAMRDLLDPRLRVGQGSYGAVTVKRKRGSWPGSSPLSMGKCSKGARPFFLPENRCFFFCVKFGQFGKIRSARTYSFLAHVGNFVLNAFVNFSNSPALDHNQDFESVDNAPYFLWTISDHFLLQFLQSLDHNDQ